MDPAIAEAYGNRLRVRVCGLCWKDGNLLMVNHLGLTTGDFWAPPGGGLEFNESVDQCLQKEFEEETGLNVRRGKFMFACEFFRKPLHAIELFFEVIIEEGELQKGQDPELPIISGVRFMSPSEIARIPNANLHGIFGLVSSPGELQTLTGFFRI